MLQENPSAEPDNIKAMKLYHQVERIFTELKALGLEDSDPLDIMTLCAFDQYHYLGTNAVDEAIRRIGINASMKVLEVGGGIGGPARYLTHKTGCQMVVLELQSDLNLTAAQLTDRCRLSDRVNHICKDILAYGSQGREQYDALVSWLTFLHIPDRKSLYAKCFEVLKPGAVLYVEDYFEKAPLTTEEKDLLRQEVYCDHIPSMNDYRRELAEAGFQDIELEDKSQVWTQFVEKRLRVFRDTWLRNVKLHGSEVVEGLDEFYATITRLFQTGNLGGIAFVARKPA